MNFALHTLTRTTITFLNAAFPKIFLNMAFSKKPTLQICFRSILSRGLNKTYVFALRLSFPQRPFLHKHCVLRKNQVFNTNHVLAGLMQGLFAACRITLSMVAGGTRRRRLYIYIYTYIYIHIHIYIYIYMHI